MHVIVFYVPIKQCEQVKSAMFAAGAGKLGAYDCCAWQTIGQGQFKPLTGSQPAIGQTDRLEIVDEYRVEMVCDKTCITEVINAMKNAHPYEEVAFHVINPESIR